MIGSILLAALSTCGPTTLPPKASANQRQCIAASRFDRATVGVAPYRYGVYSDRLLVGLRGTNLFRRVGPLQAFTAAPTFIARVERPIYGEAIVPIVTILSLGLVPTTVSEDYGYAFSLTPTQRPDRPVAIEFSYRSAATLGWWGLFVTRRGDGTLRDVYGHPQLHDALAWHIVTVRDSICSASGDCANVAQVDPQTASAPVASGLGACPALTQWSAAQ